MDDENDGDEPGRPAMQHPDQTWQMARERQVRTRRPARARRFGRLLDSGRGDAEPGPAATLRSFPAPPRNPVPARPAPVVRPLRPVPTTPLAARPWHPSMVPAAFSTRAAETSSPRAS